MKTKITLTLALLLTLSTVFASQINVVGEVFTSVT